MTNIIKCNANVHFYMLLGYVQHESILGNERVWHMPFLFRCQVVFISLFSVPRWLHFMLQNHNRQEVYYISVVTCQIAYYFRNFSGRSVFSFLQARRYKQRTYRLSTANHNYQNNLANVNNEYKQLQVNIDSKINFMLRETNRLFNNFYSQYVLQT